MTGTLHIVGLGPGDPELMTLKAARVVAAAPVIAYFHKRGRRGHARTLVEGRLRRDAHEIALEYPFTTEMSVDDPRYAAGMAAFYDQAAGRLAGRLDAGRDVALLCEGDPFFYGSSLALLDRLGRDYPHEVVPGVTGMSGCWTRAGLPMTHGDDVLTILPGTLDEARLVDRLAGSDAAVIMKVGRNLAKIGRALATAGLIDRADLDARAVYVERGTMQGERIAPLAELDHAAAPYFSTVLVPGRRRAR
jgi:precorrin-2/cobalt-factor-2 C20-methyltransferase